MAYHVKILSTRGSYPVASSIASHLEKILPESYKSPEGTLGVPTVDVFDNNNFQIQIPNVRGHFVFVVHTMVPDPNVEMMELFTLLDAIQCASPKNVAVVFSYMPYSRSDKKNQTRISTMSKRIAMIINCAYKIKNILLLDPHDEHIKHYYDPPAEEIKSIYLFMHILKQTILKEYDKKEIVIVYPDAGAHKRFAILKDELGLKSAYIDKLRKDNSGKCKASRVIGNVRDKICIMIDDEILGGGTIGQDSKLLDEYGAKLIYVCVTHPVLRKKNKTEKEFFEDLMQMSVDKFIFTDSIPIKGRFPETEKIQIISVAGLLAEAISRMAQDLSISELFDIRKVELYKMD